MNGMEGRILVGFYFFIFLSFLLDRIAKVCHRVIWSRHIKLDSQTQCVIDSERV